MRWADVDMEARIWSMPAEVAKGKRIHLVPLSSAALDILKNLPRFKKGDFVWTTVEGARPISGFSKMKTRIDKIVNIAPWTIHDLRRTATTLMAEPGSVTPEGVLPHILSAVLGHATGASRASMPTAAITAVYNRYDYLKEKRAALESWSQYVLALVKPAAKTAVS
jgi:integrase